MMLQFPEILSEISKRNVLDYFENNSLKSVGQIILQHNENSGLQTSEIIDLIDDKDKESIAASLAFEEDLWDREGCFKLITQFENSRSRNKNALLKKIKAAEEDNDHEMLLKLLKEKQIQARRKKKM
jgi:DNA primase